jgi:hypothetical protein
MKPPTNIPAESKVLINGGTVWNGIEDSTLNFFYTVDHGPVFRSPVIPFAEGSDILTNATILAFTVHVPPAKPKSYLANTEFLKQWGDEIVNPTLENGTCVVVMKDGKGGYYLASMCTDSSLPVMNLTEIPETKA